MNFTQFATALKLANTDFGLDHVDLRILHEVAAVQEGSITKIIVDKTMPVGRATLHKRIKKLCREGFLSKGENLQNQRRKVLTLGDQFQKLTDEMFKDATNPA